jgi:homopolymeric O-antigen transport system ATP-binding protein
LSEIVISVKGLSKRYRIGFSETQHETFGSQLAHWILYPIKNFKNLTRLSKFGKDEDEIDIHWALRDLDFSVSKGEVLGIIGHNGAGKSTLLKILSRITDPSLGEVRIKGRVSSLLEVGTGFHPDLSGRDNVYMNGTILGMTKKEIDERFYEIIEFSGIKKYIDTPVKRYSSGMKVRLAFSVAAHLEPDILIIDEVLAVGDAEFQKRCLGKMKEVAGEGRTVLFVSHNLNAINNLCSSTIVLNKGEKVFEGPNEEGIKKYLSFFSDSNEKFVKRRNDYLEFEKIEIFPLKGGLLNITSGIGIVFEILCKVRKVNLTTTLQLRDESGLILLHEGNVVDSSSDKGKYIVNLKIPAFTLNSGNFFVDLFFGDSFQRSILKCQNVTSFHLDNATINGIHRKLPGVLRMDLKCEKKFAQLPD